MRREKQGECWAITVAAEARDEARQERLAAKGADDVLDGVLSGAGASRGDGATGRGRAWAGRERREHRQESTLVSPSTILTLSSLRTPEPRPSSPVPRPLPPPLSSRLSRSCTPPTQTGPVRPPAVRGRCSARRWRRVVRAPLPMPSHNGGVFRGPASACCHSRLCLFSEWLASLPARPSCPPSTANKLYTTTPYHPRALSPQRESQHACSCAHTNGYCSPRRGAIVGKWWRLATCMFPQRDQHSTSSASAVELLPAVSQRRRPSSSSGRHATHPRVKQIFMSQLEGCTHRKHCIEGGASVAKL